MLSTYKKRACLLIESELPANLQAIHFLIKYLENEDIYDVGLKRGHIGNHQWAFDWPYVL